jgi:hypothetical protein
VLSIISEYLTCGKAYDYITPNEKQQIEFHALLSKGHGFSKSPKIRIDQQNHDLLSKTSATPNQGRNIHRRKTNKFSRRRRHLSHWVSEPFL